MMMNRFEYPPPPSMDRREPAADSPRRRVERMLLGSSAPITAVREQILDVAAFGDVNVLILGETGTGKDLVGRALHAAAAPRGSYVPLNCSAIPGSLFESELFGHQSGSFTGARGAREGLLQEAAGGTLFLDEVGEMPRDLQPKLLRVLDSRTFRSLGANRERIFDARVVSATNRDIGRFAGLREDLFFRLAGFTIQMPPLRKRPEDIPLLAASFLTAFCRAHQLPSLWLTDDALDLLWHHPWNGNVRELKSVMERSAIVARDGRVDARVVRQGLLATSPSPPRRGSIPAPPASATSLRASVGRGMGLREAEREIILGALDRNEGNVARTARELGLPRSTLRARLRRYEVALTGS